MTEIISRIAQTLAGRMPGTDQPEVAVTQSEIELARDILLAIRDPDPLFWARATDASPASEHEARTLWHKIIDAALPDEQPAPDAARINDPI
jgi:hypothetical protein